jgi:peptidoglycan/xylan/chitin deacetylase (PgdA/CDA1 family)
MLSPEFPGLATGISAAAALILATGGLANAILNPTSQIFGAALAAPRSPGQLALTFDDGPNPVWTPRLLEILARHNLPATFFLIGRFADEEPSLVREIVAAGHTIGNHSWSHPNLALTSSAKIEEELTRTKRKLEYIAGVPIRFFRPPFGARRPAVLRIARSLGMIPVTWTAITNDWSDPSADSIAAHLTAKIDRTQKAGWASNIVLHDGGHRERAAYREPSIQAAAKIAERYGATHNFVTLDAWAEAAPQN